MTVISELNFQQLAVEIFKRVEGEANQKMIRKWLQDFMWTRLKFECFDAGEVESKYPEIAKFLLSNQ